MWRSAHAPGCAERVDSTLASLRASDPASAAESCDGLAAHYGEECGFEHRDTCASERCVHLAATFQLRGCPAAPPAEWSALLHERLQQNFQELESWDALRKQASMAARCVAEQATSDRLWQAMQRYLESLAAATEHQVPAEPPAPGSPPSLTTALLASMQCYCPLDDGACSAQGFLASLGCEPPFSRTDRRERIELGTRRPSGCGCRANDLMCNMHCSR
jgi:hypothetical protein